MLGPKFSASGLTPVNASLVSGQPLQTLLRHLERVPEAFETLLREKSITDIVLYGDTRPIHAHAIDRARDLGVRIHVFEEGYLRPYWVTYERDGSTGHSKLMDMDLVDMFAALHTGSLDEPAAPAHWGEMRHHMFYGALYHFFVLCLNQVYPRF